MNWIYRFDRKYGRRFGLSNLFLYIAASMLAVYLLSVSVMPDLPYYLYFNRDLILSGQVWRLITFIVVPLDFEILRLFIYLFCYYSFSRSVEGSWGPCLFTLYYIFGVIGAILSGFVVGITTNYYINLSIILAFACLYPNEYINLMFVLPIKAKWLGLVYAALLLYNLWAGTMMSRVALLFSLLNCLLFFGPDIWRTMRRNIKQSKNRSKYRNEWGKNNPWR